MLFKLSNLNSNLALTLGYLNPALNNSALGEERHCEAKSFDHGSDVMATLGHGPADLKFEVITVQPANLTSIQWAPILVLPFFSPFPFSFYRKCWLIVPTSSHQCHSQGRGHQKDSSHLIPSPPLFIKKKVERYPSLSTSRTCAVGIYLSLHHYHVSPCQRYHKAIGFCNK